MIKRAVILDTNAVNNDNPEGRLLREYAILEDIVRSEKYILLIPRIVLEEIFEHKKRCFLEEKGKLARNKLIDMVATKQAVNNLKMTKTLEDYLKLEPMKFAVIDVTDTVGAMKKLRKLALKNEPPFDRKSDKGFKDGIVAMTVEEFIVDNPDKAIVFVSDDGRLGEYFEKNKNVAVVKTLEELEATYGDEIKASNQNNSKRPLNAAPNIHMNRIAKARELLTLFRNSTNFANTHSVISELNQYKNDLTDSDCADIIRSTTENSQIYWIVDDPDVSDFVFPIFERIKNKISIDDYNAFVRNTSSQDKYPIISEMSGNADVIPF